MRKVMLTSVVMVAAWMILGTNQNLVQGREGQAPAMKAWLAFDAQGRGMVEVVSKEKLVQPKVQHHVGKWVSFHEPSQKIEGEYLYRAKSYYTLSENMILTLKSLSTDEKDEFTTSLVVPSFAAGGKVPVALRVGEAEQIAKGKEKEPTAGGAETTRGDIGLGIINRFRALRGLPPIKYDPEFARVSRVNNEMGGVHRYNTGWQTWASPADPESAVSMWMGAYYNSHGVIIMNPNITKGATNSHPVYGTTFTGN
ncbi:MAG: CAP domain-containing protein [Planctomycetota bacterium]|nr:CAP domain-containing protein [Planctomycetota bacterium]